MTGLLFYANKGRARDDGKKISGKTRNSKKKRQQQIKKYKKKRKTDVSQRRMDLIRLQQQNKVSFFFGNRFSCDSSQGLRNHVGSKSKNKTRGKRLDITSRAIRWVLFSFCLSLTLSGGY